MQIDHILAKADQHLGRGLPVDAAVDVRLAGKIVFQLPVVGDGVAEEHDSILAGRGRLEGGVGLAIAFEFSEIVGVDGDARGAVLIEIGGAGGRDAGLLGQGWKIEESKQNYDCRGYPAAAHGRKCYHSVCKGPERMPPSDGHCRFRRLAALG